MLTSRPSVGWVILRFTDVTDEDSSSHFRPDRLPTRTAIADSNCRSHSSAYRPHSTPVHSGYSTWMGVIFLKTGTAQADALLFRSRGMTRLSDDDSDWPSQGNYPLPQSGVYSSDDMAGNCFSILGKFFPGRREGRQWTDSALRLTHDLRLCLRWPSCTSSPPLRL
jgi:hypothetical protein